MHAHFLLVVSERLQVGCQHSRSCVVGGQVRGYTSVNDYMASMESAGGNAAHAKSIVLWECNSHPLLLSTTLLPYRVQHLFFCVCMSKSTANRPVHPTGIFVQCLRANLRQQVSENPFFLHNFSSFLKPFELPFAKLW